MDIVVKNKQEKYAVEAVADLLTNTEATIDYLCSDFAKAVEADLSLKLKLSDIKMLSHLAWHLVNCENSQLVVQSSK